MMIAARLCRGPFDGEILTLPKPVPICAIPDQAGKIVIVHIYLKAEQDDEQVWYYLYELLD